MEKSPRIAIAALALSASGMVYIAQREGYQERAYPDPVHGTKVPTVGFGTTEGVKMGDTLPPVRALIRLRADAAEYELGLKRCLPYPMHQHEWDAFVGLAYNVGVTPVCKNNDRTGPSTIARELSAGNYLGACNAILLYDRAGPVNKPQDRCSHPDNRTCRGIWSDRQQLQKMCVGEATP